MAIKLHDIKRIYFIGIGGIGMSAVARYFMAHGVVVNGYDKTETVLTRQLASEGAGIVYTDDVECVDAAADVVVYTPAIPSSHQGLAWYRNEGYPVLKRSDVLQLITDASFNICVAGTHGKTSISTMIGHILRHSSYGCNAFLGGVSVNYGTNFWGAPNDVCVVEADEFDRSFLKLWPSIAVVTSMDADHLDIYGTAEQMEDAFVQFVGQIKPEGLLIRKHGLRRLDAMPIRRQLSYCLHQVAGDDHHAGSDVHAANISIQAGEYHFDAHIAGQEIRGLRMQANGWHNLENMLAAITVAKSLKIADSAIAAAVADYKGVKRRFEYWLHTTNSQGKEVVMIDDYAHHPEELRALIGGARSLYPHLPCHIAFQPHLYSRTHDHAAAFGEVLSQCDTVTILPIYPARELPMPGVTSQLIANHMPDGKGQVLSKEDWLKSIDASAGGLWLTAGAGDIDTLLEQVKQTLQQP